MGSDKIIKLLTIPMPKEGTRAVVHFEKGAKIIGKGVGSTTLVCGKCEEPVAENITDSMIMNIVVRCNRCGAHNDIPLSWKVFHLVNIEKKINYPILLIGIGLIILSQFDNNLTKEYGNKIIFIGIFISILSTIVLLRAEKIVKYFVDSRGSY